MNTDKHCPKCKVGHLDERVHRSLPVRLFLFWLPIRRYICYRCGKKSYVLYRGGVNEHRDYSRNLAAE